MDISWWNVVLVSVLVIVQLVIADQASDIRLVKGATPRIGRLEVRVDGKWMPIYDDGRFGEREATVACRQLGYVLVSAQVFQGGSFGRGSYSSKRLTRVHCRGGENSLDECQSSVCSPGECSFDLDIGISCEIHDDHYMGPSSSYRRWTGLVVLLIIVPFFGHAYKRRSEYGYHDRSLIPIPRYHHGRVPFPSSAVDDSSTNPTQTLPPEPLAPVFPNGYVYPPSGPLIPTSSFVQMSSNSCERTEGTTYNPPRRFLTSQSAPSSNSGGPENGQNTHSRQESVNAVALANLQPPEYSEFDRHSRSIEANASQTRYDSVPGMGPPPSYEDVVKT